MDTRADRFPLFDSLRAIAALMVICSHIGSFGGVAAEGGNVRPYTGQFAVAVPIFLLISGFLLYRPFTAARIRGNRMPSVRAYGWRRVLRIVPAYWVALTVIGLWLGSHYLFYVGEPPADIFSAKGLLAYYGFLQLYLADTRGGGIAQAWTVDTEVAFYLALPVYAVLAYWLTRRYRMGWRGEVVLLCGIAALSLAYKAVVVATDADEPIPVTPLGYFSSLPAYADHFALGMILGVVSVAMAAREHDPRWVEVIDRRPWLPWLAAVVAFLLAVKAIGMEGSPVEEMEPWQYFARHALYGVIAFGLLLPAIFGDVRRGWVRRLLGNRALLHFGMVSYGVYLWHLAWIMQLTRWDWAETGSGLERWLLWLPPVVLGAWLLGSLSYYAIERPALSLKRLVPDPRAAADQPGAVSAPSTPPAVRS
jgi:peptidoglycan/LPS O-acetylase OafA/YrhL